MSDYFLAKEAFEKERDKLHKTLCSKCPGGPDGYKLLEPRCVKIRQPKKEGETSQRSRKSRYTPEYRKLLKDQVPQFVDIVNAHQQTVNEILQMHSSEDSVNTSAVTPSEEDVFLSLLHQKWLSFAPVFIVYATKRMVDEDKIKEFPDVRKRYKHIARKFHDGEEEGIGMFENNIVVEHSVAKLVLRKIKDVLLG